MANSAVNYARSQEASPLCIDLVGLVNEPFQRARLEDCKGAQQVTRFPATVDISGVVEIQDGRHCGTSLILNTESSTLERL